MAWNGEWYGMQWYGVNNRLVNKDGVAYLGSSCKQASQEFIRQGLHWAGLSHMGNVPHSSHATLSHSSLPGCNLTGSQPWHRVQQEQSYMILSIKASSGRYC